MGLQVQACCAEGDPDRGLSQSLQARSFAVIKLMQMCGSPSIQSVPDESPIMLAYFCQLDSSFCPVWQVGACLGRRDALRPDIQWPGMPFVWMAWVLLCDDGLRVVHLAWPHCRHKLRIECRHSHSFPKQGGPLLTGWHTTIGHLFGALLDRTCSLRRHLDSSLLFFSQSCFLSLLRPSLCCSLSSKTYQRAKSNTTCVATCFPQLLPECVGPSAAPLARTLFASPPAMLALRGRQFASRQLKTCCGGCSLTMI